MNEFIQLIEIAERLLGPNGCPWDREQTLSSLQPYLLEETHELIEAIDDRQEGKISEELGDLFYALVFVGKLGEKEGLFSLAEALQSICDKLIRRHPHVFGDVIAETSEEIVHNWEQIKKTEFKERKSALDGIPPSLPALPRAQKIINKIRRAQKGVKKNSSLESEEEFGGKLWEILEIADGKGWSTEDILRRMCQKREREFRDAEKTPEMDS